MSESQAQSTSGSETMSAMLAADAPAAPSRHQATQQETDAARSREEAADSQLLGLNRADADVEAAKDIAKGFTGEERDKAGRFTGKKTVNSATNTDADHSKADEDDEAEAEATAEADDETDDAETDGDDESFDDLIGAADKLDGIKVPDEGTRRQAEVGSAAQPASSTTKAEEKKEETVAEDDDEKPFTAAELEEIKRDEGWKAFIDARDQNMRIKERREAREEKTQKATQEKAQADYQRQVTEARKTVNEVIMPAVFSIVKKVPALAAIYGKPGTELDKLLDTQVDAIGGIVAKAKERVERSKHDPDRKSPLTLGEAIKITLAQKHKDEIQRAGKVTDTREAVTVKRHNLKSLSPSGGGKSGGGSGDPMKEMKSLAAAFRGG